MKWIKKILGIVKPGARNSAVQDESRGGRRNNANSGYDYGLSEPFRGAKYKAACAARARHNSEEPQTRVQYDIDAEAQPYYGAFEIVLRNDPDNNTYQQIVRGSYDALMYSALMLIEYMGRQDEEQVRLACERLSGAARMYHEKQRDRITDSARALFSGAEESGVLDVDFL